MRHLGLLSRGVGIVLFLGIFLTQCTEDRFDERTREQQQFTAAIDVEMNPNPADLGELPPATIDLKTFAPKTYLKDGDFEESTLTPEVLEISLRPGESITEHKEAVVAAAPPKGDIMFLLDLTGSMGGELNNAKANSINIMNEIRSLIGDSYFGASSHMDYNGFFSGCGYAASYGGGSDYPYLMNQDLTTDIGAVSSAINGLALGWGNDGPESYVTALHGVTLGSAWRDGAKKIVIAWGDNIPHDCALGTGPEPGGDNVANTEDDLVLSEVLNEMQNENVTLLALHSGGRLALWDGYAAATGGDAVQINGDGTIPGGVDIAEFITGLIQVEFDQIDELTLQVCDEAYADWLTSVSPESFFDITLSENNTFEFDIEITVPEGTASGVYSFEVCLVGDGVEYATQQVVVTVIELPVDVHPTSCPNPVNRNGNGVYPAAVLGTADYDISTLVPESIVLKVKGVDGEVPPIRFALEDVATPFDGVVDSENPDRMACTTEGPDGFVDLTLKYDRQAFSALLSDFSKGDEVIVHLEGEFENGDRFFGSDVVWIVK